MKNKEQDIRIDIDFCEVCLDDKLTTDLQFFTIFTNFKI